MLLGISQESYNLGRMDIAFQQPVQHSRRRAGAKRGKCVQYNAHNNLKRSFVI